MFRVYMDSAKQEVSLFVVDESKQRDNETYLGLLLFEAIDTDRQSTSGHLPITMPKVDFFFSLWENSLKIKKKKKKKKNLFIRHFTRRDRISIKVKDKLIL